MYIPSILCNQDTHLVNRRVLVRFQLSWFENLPPNLRTLLFLSRISPYFPRKTISFLDRRGKPFVFIPSPPLPHPNSLSFSFSPLSLSLSLPLSVKYVYLFSVSRLCRVGTKPLSFGFPFSNGIISPPHPQPPPQQYHQALTLSFDEFPHRIQIWFVKGQFTWNGWYRECIHGKALESHL